LDYDLNLLLNTDFLGTYL